MELKVTKEWCMSAARHEADPEPRFFIDHGMIHDRKTGKHVTTDKATAFEDGIEACCALLNELNERTNA